MTIKWNVLINCQSSNKKQENQNLPLVEFWRHENYAMGIVKEMRHHPSMQGVTLYLKKNKT